MRAVLDTNVLVSATLIKGGTENKILRAWREGRFELVLSPPILEEMGRALLYEKLEKHPWMTREELTTFIQLLAQACVLASGATRVRVCRDPDDDKFLAAAVERKAAWLVSRGDVPLSSGRSRPVEPDSRPDTCRRQRSGTRRCNSRPTSTATSKSTRRRGRRRSWTGSSVLGVSVRVSDGGRRDEKIARRSPRSSQKTTVATPGRQGCSSPADVKLLCASPTRWSWPDDTGRISSRMRGVGIRTRLRGGAGVPPLACQLGSQPRCPRARADTDTAHPRRVHPSRFPLAPPGGRPPASSGASHRVRAGATCQAISVRGLRLTARPRRPRRRRVRRPADAGSDSGEAEMRPPRGGPPAPVWGRSRGRRHPRRE